MWVGRAELAAAVSEVGGLGIITALTQPTPADLVKQIERARTMTDKPIGVNLTILPSINPPPYSAYRRGIIDAGTWNVGQVQGIIRDIPPTDEVVRRTVADAHRVLTERLGSFA